jgi:hypothetical protein
LLDILTLNQAQSTNPSSTDAHLWGGSMTSSFKVLARDGSEHGPLKAEQLYLWYRDGRIARDSLTCEKGTANWRRLDTVFDLSTWDASGEDASSPTPNLVSKPVIQTAWDDDRRTSGMLAAAILLFINAAFSVATVAFLFLTPTPGLQGKEMVSPTFFWLSVPIMDLIVGVGLLRGKWQFRRFAMIRATLGVFAVLARALLLQSPSGWIELVFQLVFAAGMFGLLFGGPPSRERVFAGAFAVVLAWFGSVGGVVVDEYLGYPIEEPEAQVRPGPDFLLEGGRRFSGGMVIEDYEAGFKLELHSGWSLKHSKDGEPAEPGTNLVASNSIAGCTAMLQIDTDSEEAKSLDHYLNQLIETRKMSVPTLTATSRSNVMIDGRVGRRLHSAWTERNTPFIGFSTVCRNGSGYFVLTGWCEESVYEFAFPAFQTLEASFQFTGLVADSTADKLGKPKRSPRRKRK